MRTGPRNVSAIDCTKALEILAEKWNSWCSVWYTPTYRSGVMKDEHEDVSTDDDMVRIIMDIYGLTEQEARRALSEVTAKNRWTDF